MLSFDRRTLMRLAPLALLLFAAPIMGGQPEGLAEWEHNHYRGAHALGDWVKQNPDAAKAFFDWDGEYPDAAKLFVGWAVNNRTAPIELFLKNHPNMTYFSDMSQQHRTAFNAFIAWCRAYPAAAEGLFNHPLGLKWIGAHLSEAASRMKHAK